MDTKKWYTSKIFWGGVLTTVIASLQVAQEWLNSATLSPESIITLVIGILIVVWRVWFTDKKIEF